jgi:nitrogen regulatory protein P-II 2
MSDMSSTPPAAGTPATPLTGRQLLTIIAEAVLEQRLIHDVKELGAKGYSIGHVRGEGATGRRTVDWAGPSVRLESVVTDEVAAAIIDHLAAEYFAHFAVVAWLTPVLVARPDRY